MDSYIRKCRTACDAIEVQIEHKDGRRRVGIDHIGSDYDDAELELLVEEDRRCLNEE